MGLISVLKVKSGKSSGVEIKKKKKKKASYKTVTCQVFIPVYILLPL